MSRFALLFSVGAVLCMVCRTPAVWAQEANPEDANIDLIRSMTTISAGDQDRIGRWVQFEVDRAGDLKSFRQRVLRQFEHNGNSPAFRAELAGQFAQTATRGFSAPQADPVRARMLARVLVDIGRPETVPALIAALSVNDAATRYLAAGALAALKRSIAADRELLTQVVEAVRRAAIAEADPVALGRLYEALSFASQPAAVFDAYLAVFDRRLERRRARNGLADGAERFAWHFFRQPEVLNALSADQKSQLVGRIATFMRLDTERYAEPQLSFDEVDRIERMLDGMEDVLVRVAGNVGGNVRGAMEQGGYDNRQAVLHEAYRWAGNPNTSEPGALNAAPWNVPAGAP